MSDLYARPDHWTDVLPESWKGAINTSPLLNALGRALNRPAPNLEKASLDIFGRPEDKAEADRQWLLQQARGPSFLERMNPVAQDAVNKLGLYANFIGPAAKLPPPAPKPTGIRAYHGSPHDFDKFDISKIGTGEGAQAYGRGLYFAENEGVARSYRDALSDNIDKIAARARFHRILNEIDQAQRTDPSSHRVKLRADVEAAMARLEEIPPAGRMYEVNIKADPDQFLDWDKPLSQQPEGVRRALEAANLVPWKTRNPLGIEYGNLSKESALALSSRGQRPIEPDLNATGADLLNWEVGAGRPVAKQETSDRLRDAGIPGIKYLDQQSRVAGQGSRNYVVFDDKLIEILRKYGLLPPVAAGTAAALNQEQPQQ